MVRTQTDALVSEAAPGSIPEHVHDEITLELRLHGRMVEADGGGGCCCGLTQIRHERTAGETGNT